MELLHQMIKNQKTGSPQKLADTMGINKMTVYNLISQLKDINPTLQYDSTKETYYYGDGFPKQMIISISLMDNNTISKILNINGIELKKNNFYFS